MNWDSPAVKRALTDLQETLFLQGRDSRIVRGAFAYSRLKKRWLAAAVQGWRRLTQKHTKPENRLKIFFWLPGGLGDAACARRLVDNYRALLPGADFEIYSPVPHAVETIFAGVSGITAASTQKQYWGNYDLAVLACLSVKFLAADEARLSRLAPLFFPVYQKAKAAQRQLGFLSEDPFLTELALGRWLLKMGGKRFDLLSFTGGTDLPHEAQQQIPVQLSALTNWGLAPQTYLTFHDGATGRSLPTRMWPNAHWKALLTQLKRTYAPLKIVQIGTAENPVYPQADICLCGKTRLTDLPALLAGAVLHLDTESGLVHLAQYLPTKSVVLFGPSDTDFFAYQKNINLAGGDCGGCMWMTTNWMQRCPLSQREAACLRAITPACVLQAVAQALGTIS